MKKVSVAANIVLLTFIAGLAVDLFYNIIDYHFQAISAPQAALTVKPSSPDAALREKNPSLAFYEPIIGRDLFEISTRKSAQPKAPDPTKDLEATDLNIKLWGTVTGNGGPKYAVIEARGENRRREQQLYKVGDTVDTATIEQILGDSVILSHNGQRQVLQMEQFLQGGGSRRAIGRSSRNRTRRPRVYRRTLSRKMVDNAAQNFNQLITQARIVPDPNGMKISRIKPGSFFRRLGFRNGDVIKSVNNSQIRSVEDAMGIYRDLQSGGSLSIELMRRGRPRTIQYKVR